MHVHAGRLKGALLLIVATSAWGGMFSVAKDAIQWLDPVFVTVVRYTAVAMILTIILFLAESAFRPGQPCGMVPSRPAWGR